MKPWGLRYYHTGRKWSGLRLLSSLEDAAEQFIQLTKSDFVREIRLYDLRRHMHPNLGDYVLEWQYPDEAPTKEEIKAVPRRHLTLVKSKLLR